MNRLIMQIGMTSYWRIKLKKKRQKVDRWRDGNDGRRKELQCGRIASNF